MPGIPGATPPPALVVLAAGMSTRFGRLKQLEPIGPGGEALLDYALYDGARAGFSPFILVIQEANRPAFEAHLHPATEAGLDIRFVHQGLTRPGLLDDPLPGRTRPWGTGFALLAATEHVDGPFAMCNADDFYGRGAYGVLFDALGTVLARSTTEPDGDGMPNSTSLPAFTVAYPLEATLSENGGVSRGICRTGKDGALRRLTEGLEMRRQGDRVLGLDPDGNPVDVGLRTPVCTSLWGFLPGIQSLLAPRFSAFLAAGPEPDAEFYLTEAVNHLIGAGRLACTLLPSGERWLGVTFPEDKPAVAESLWKLVDSGVYPRGLWNSP